MSDAFILAEEKGTEMGEGIFFPKFSLILDQHQEQTGIFLSEGRHS